MLPMKKFKKTIPIKFASLGHITNKIKRENAKNAHSMLHVKEDIILYIPKLK